ncbi:MAG: DmsC/YnfH family molybdoenzyme membrane anchor subunit, partial [Burkholderiaceae bacterium]|nr:DmsC/YnfH family molybdoenzyme membrane anchor subunit [Burkholderiaceae bacterium]
RPLLLATLGTALVLAVAGLACSFLHLGRPARAWRAVLMWRTSWLSREVIVLPAYMLVLALWWIAAWQGRDAPLLAAGALLLSAVLWICTGMIYKCIRFIGEWAHWLTLANYTLIGLASGALLTAALAIYLGEMQAGRTLQWCALAIVCVAAAFRIASLLRNARLVPRSTLQSATGIRSASVRQTSMGMTGGSFNTREFFHGKSAGTLRLVKPGFLLLGFAVPALALAASLWTGAFAWLVMALAAHLPGVLAERWFFFAQARHPQNLYYQVVS